MSAGLKFLLVLLIIALIFVLTLIFLQERQANPEFLNFGSGQSQTQDSQTDSAGTTTVFNFSPVVQTGNSDEGSSEESTEHEYTEEELEAMALAEENGGGD